MRIDDMQANLIWGKRSKCLQHCHDFWLLQLGHIQHHVEGGADLHVLHDSPSTGGPQHQELSPLGRLLLQQHQQGLKDRVAEAGSNCYVLQQPLNVIQYDDGEDRLHTQEIGV